MCISQFIQTTTKAVSLSYRSQRHVHLPVYTNDNKDCLLLESISTACTSPSLYKPQQCLPFESISTACTSLSLCKRQQRVSRFGMDLNGMYIFQFIQTTTKSFWYRSQRHVHLPVYTNHNKDCILFVSISMACTSPSLYKPQQRVFGIDLSGMYISQFTQTTTVPFFGIDLSGMYISQFIQTTTKSFWYRSQRHVHLPVYTNDSKELLVSISTACTSPSLYKRQQRTFGIDLNGINISQFIQTTTVSSFGINLVYSIPPLGACSCGTDRKRKSRQTCKNQQSGSADTESCHLQRGQDTSPLSEQWRLEETQRWISGTP